MAGWREQVVADQLAGSVSDTFTCWILALNTTFYLVSTTKSCPPSFLRTFLAALHVFFLLPFLAIQQ